MGIASAFLVIVTNPFQLSHSTTIPSADNFPGKAFTFLGEILERVALCNSVTWFKISVSDFNLAGHL